MSGTGLKRPEAQALLGRFLFSGWDEHEKRVTSLSGGERRRLALAIVVASGANFLVLDEPTNHLDLESREALEVALDAFPGTVLLVSHDRARARRGRRAGCSPSRTGTSSRTRAAGPTTCARRRASRPRRSSRDPQPKPKARAAEASGEAAADGAPARRGGGRARRGPRRRARGEAGARLGRHGAPVGAPRGARGSRGAAQALGEPLRGRRRRRSPSSRPRRLRTRAGRSGPR